MKKILAMVLLAITLGCTMSIPPNLEARRLERVAVVAANMGVDVPYNLLNAVSTDMPYTTQGIVRCWLPIHEVASIEFNAYVILNDSVIAHELRHVQQCRDGLMTGSNNHAMEADAYDYANRYCRQWSCESE